jgi:hypothetical protein
LSNAATSVQRIGGQDSLAEAHSLTCGPALEKRRRGHERPFDVLDPQLVETERDPELAAMKCVDAGSDTPLLIPTTAIATHMQPRRACRR